MAPHTYRPQTNGKAERFIQTMLREWAYSRLYTSNEERLNRLPRWLQFYNQRRPHTALGGKPPMAALLNNVRGNYNEPALDPLVVTRLLPDGGLYTDAQAAATPKPDPDLGRHIARSSRRVRRPAISLLRLLTIANESRPVGVKETGVNRQDAVVASFRKTL